MSSLDFKKYNAFNLSHDKKLTCDMGQLVPCLCKEVVPGDVWRCNANMFMRLIPQLAPFMHEVKAYIHYFFVPYRLVKKNFEKFITKGFSGTDVVPWSYVQAPSGGFGKYSLADYFGLPIDVAGIQVDAMPFRAYDLIVNEWYLNENLQTYLTWSDGDGLDTTTPLTVQYRNWMADYFTSALPFAQRGAPVYLPLGTSAPVSVYGTGIALGLTNSRDNAGLRTAYAPGTDTTSLRAWSSAYGEALGNSFTPIQVGSDSPELIGGPIGVTTDPTKSGLTGIANLTTATAATINDIRTAFQVQRWMEKNARGGVRYIEFLLSHFGEKSSDARLQRPEYLGGGKSIIVTSEVLQTSSTDSVSPQGNMSGHSFSAQKTMSFERRFEEFGVIIGILSIMPRTQYQQGIERMWTRKTPLEYYFPTFAHLGQQGLLGQEICATGTSYDTAVWGFQDRFQELRTAFSTVSGDFRDTLNYWTMTRIFDKSNPPQLNANFVSANDVTKRIFNVTNAHCCLVDIGFNIQCLRKLPKHGTPGLIDHA